MKYMIPVLTAVILLSFAAPAMADPCTSVKREMTYGRVALQDAKNKQDYLDSAKQFEAAVDKAPGCAAAHFNLGVVYEKTGEYQKALKALKKYLSLAPGAPDADKVQEKIYELEFRAKKAKEPRPPKPEDLEGYWRKEGNPRPSLVTAEGDYYIAFDKFDTFISTMSTGKVKFRLNGYQLEGTAMIIGTRGDLGSRPDISCLDKAPHGWRPIRILGTINQDFKSIVFRYIDIYVSKGCRIGRHEFTVTFSR